MVKFSDGFIVLSTKILRSKDNSFVDPPPRSFESFKKATRLDLTLLGAMEFFVIGKLVSAKVKVIQTILTNKVFGLGPHFATVALMK